MWPNLIPLCCVCAGVTGARGQQNVQPLSPAGNSEDSVEGGSHGQPLNGTSPAASPAVPPEAGAPPAQIPHAVRSPPDGRQRGARQTSASPVLPMVSSPTASPRSPSQRRTAIAARKPQLASPSRKAQPSAPAAATSTATRWVLVLQNQSSPLSLVLR